MEEQPNQQEDDFDSDFGKSEDEQQQDEVVEQVAKTMDEEVRRLELKAKRARRQRARLPHFDSYVDSLSRCCKRSLNEHSFQ
jgi:predicted HD phosphohydrolase